MTAARWRASIACRPGILAAVLAAVFAGLAEIAAAQSLFPTPAPDSSVASAAILIPNGQTSGGQPVMAPPSATNPLVTEPTPSSATGSVTAATLDTASAQVLAAASRRFLAIDNESASATIACALGAPAALNSAGSFTIPPMSARVWHDNFVPSDAVDCIASSAATPVTIEAN